MSLLNFFGIGDALAQTATTTTTAAHPQQGSITSLLFTLAIFIAVFYFLLIRPQTKRAKEHRKLIEGLGKDDEVVTSGGLAGRVTDINDNFVTIKIAKEVEVSFQKNAIAMILPKGTLKNL
ncbi:MAG: preprotein translocase subunit YajC [Gammaproteobacteria bacterium]